jgi:hypothetical protein
MAHEGWLLNETRTQLISMDQDQAFAYNFKNLLSFVSALVPFFNLPILYFNQNTGLLGIAIVCGSFLSLVISRIASRAGNRQLRRHGWDGESKCKIEVQKISQP